MSDTLVAALHLPRRFAQASWPRRIAAVAIFAAAAAAVWWAMHLPVPMAVEDAKGWQAMSGDEIRLIDPDGASLLTFEGPVGKAITLSLANARVSAASATGLGSLGVTVPRTPAEIDWATDDGGDGRAVVRLRLTPTGPRPALRVQMNSIPGQTGLIFMGEEARLTVWVSGVLVPAKPSEPAAAAKSPDAHVRIGDQEFDVTAGAFPLEADAPAGAPVSLSYGQADPDRGLFRWGVRPGSAQHFSDLSLAAVQLRRAGEPDRVDACGAAPHAFVALFGDDVAKMSCARTLKLRGLDLSQSGGAVQAEGLGFVSTNGQAHVFSWKEFAENPLLNGLAGAAFSGLVLWTIHAVLGRPKPPPAASATGKPRRLSKAA